MCGIAGVFGGSCTDNTLDTMMEKLEHRGPDDSGVYCSEEALMGHARLSIIDVAGGKQPIFNEDGTICIVFNGEIYNHKRLREQLREKHTFSSRTDTEVILHLYEEIGEQCVSLLDGMFSFAIYDERRGLFLARDPLGIKPLYTGFDDGSIYFASEMKALLGVVPEFREFPAGHSYSSEGGFRRVFSLKTPLCPPLARGVQPEMCTREAIDLLRHYVERAVEKRLMSDVPLGVFLSGGLDSSIIAAVASGMLPQLKTFSVGMEESPDREHAHIAAEYLGTEHYEHVYTVDDMLAALPEVIYYLESYDAALVRSAIPNYFLARLASQHVKVVLSGEGADEIFSGYHYLKELAPEELHNELVEITESLHNTNLQRCDRMTMAHGIEGRVPFLDVDLVRFAFRLPLNLKLGPDDTEKWILREAFRDCLPPEIIDRRKSKFSEGCGSYNKLAEIAEEEISDAEFGRSSVLPSGRHLPNKEELMYYRIFTRFFPAEAAHNAIGFSHSL